MEKMKIFFKSGKVLTILVTKENKKIIIDNLDYNKLITIDYKTVIFLNKVDYILFEEE